MVHVEVDHGGPFQTVRQAGVGRADGDVVEKAEAHGAGRLGMMAGRANRAEGVAGLAVHDGIHRRADRAGGAQGGLSRTRGDDGIHVQETMALPWHRIQDVLHVILRMDSV